MGNLAEVGLYRDKPLRGLLRNVILHAAANAGIAVLLVMAVASRAWGPAVVDAVLFAVVTGTWAAWAHIYRQRGEIDEMRLRKPRTLGGAIAHSASPQISTTLGWRTWRWDITKRELRSPIYPSVWHTAELRCEGWDESSVVHGTQGIHAHLVPENWEWQDAGDATVEANPDGSLSAVIPVHGIVERFGKYVLGTQGWRAEWAMIRKLKAPSNEIGLQLEAAFPDIEVIYGDR